LNEGTGKLLLGAQASPPAGCGCCASRVTSWRGRPH